MLNDLGAWVVSTISGCLQILGVYFDDLLGSTGLYWFFFSTFVVCVIFTCLVVPLIHGAGGGISVSKFSPFHSSDVVDVVSEDKRKP